MSVPKNESHIPNERAMRTWGVWGEDEGRERGGGLPGGLGTSPLGMLWEIYQEPENVFFEGDVHEDFMKLTWEEQPGEIFSITYMTWGRETRSKYSKRVKI